MKQLDMKAPAFAVLLCTAAAVSAQTRAPTPEEQAFARLPLDIQQMLSNMTPAQAMQAIAQTGQHSIALGNPQPGQEQFRSTLGALLASPSTYVSGGAGATTFPPLSPLVAPPPPPFLR